MRFRTALGAALVFVAFGALFAAIFSPVLLAHAYVGDAVDQLLEALPAYLGTHPFWEPRTMLGYPLGADPNQAYFYPLALLRALPGTYDWYEIAAYALAACGTFGLVRASTRSTLGACAGALAFALGGFMIGQAGHISIVEPAAWVPFLFWGLTELRVRARAPAAALLCVASLALALTAGQPQPVVYALFFALPYAALAARRADDGSRAYAVRALLAFALGAGCAGIALVPEAELFRASARASFGFERFGEFTVPVLQQPLRLFFPYALGYSGLAPYARSGIDVGSFAEMSDYAGIACAILAVVAVRRARAEPFATYWIVATVVALLLATGNQLGIARLTYLVPVFDLFRAPGRIAVMTDLGIGVLAGFGVAAIETGRARAADVRGACATVAVAMACSFALFAVLSRLSPSLQVLAISGWAALDPNPFTNAALAVPFVTLVCVSCALLAWAARPASVPLRALVLGVVLADMLGFASFAYWRSGAFGAERLLPPAYAATLRARLAVRNQRVVSVPLPGVDDGGIGPNLNLLWDVPSLRGYTPLQLARTHAFFDSDWGVPVWPLATAFDRTLDLASVRYAIVVASPEVAAEHASVDPVSLFLREGRRWRLVDQIGADTILENERALPRAWIVHRTLPAAAPDAHPTDGTDVLAAMRRPDFDPRTTAYVEGPLPPLATRAATGEVARVDELAAAHMRVRTACATACFLITSDTTYPGWSAEIDGRPAPIYAADEALRGVALPAGRHDVVFRYAAASFAAGRGVTVASLVLTALLALTLRRRPRPAARPSTGSG